MAALEPPELSSPDPLQHRAMAKEKPNKVISLVTPWMGQGMPAMLSCYHCTESGWRHPHRNAVHGGNAPTAAPEELPLAPWCTLPWEHSCAELLLLSPLGSPLPTHPDGNRAWLQGFHSRAQKTQWRAAHNHFSPCRLCTSI